MDEIDEHITASYVQPFVKEQQIVREEERLEENPIEEDGQKIVEMDEDVWMQPQQQYRVSLFMIIPNQP